MNTNELHFILFKMGLINKEQYIEVEKLISESPNKNIEQILIENNIVDEISITRAKGIKYGVPLVHLGSYAVPVELLKYVPIELAKKKLVFPVVLEKHTLRLATTDPLDYYTFEQISQLTGKQIIPLLSTKSDILAAINKAYIQLDVDNILEDVEKEYIENELDSEVEQEVIALNNADVDNTPIVKAVNIIFEQAYKLKASDIHIEPSAKEVKIRNRIDGSLNLAMTLNSKSFGALLTRIKVIAGLDIAERRVPQDGRMVVAIDGININMRVSTLPTVYGEKIVIRILGSSEEGLLSLDELNMMPYNLKSLKKLLTSPNGVVLVTGPTGSGKTTTVYSVLNHLLDPTINIVSVEDPVEKTIEGICQVPINAKSGLTFAIGLRSILRQDPDIVMVGEIRDSETATIAARAAITGHLVVSTIHTNDAPSTFLRMVDMGVEPYMVATSVASIIAQRLIKKICPKCKQEYTPKEEELAIWKGELPEKFYYGAGCVSCNNTGYSGRMPVHEIVVVNSDLRSLILKGATTEEIRDYLFENGFKDMLYNAQVLVSQGITTIQELIKTVNTLD